MSRTTILDSVFASLPDDVRRRLVESSIERRLATGEVLFRAGDEATGLFVVLSGKLRVSRETARHVEMLHLEERGGILGEIPVFGGVRFPATAVATEPTQCVVVPRTTTDRLLQDSPEFARFALQRLARRAQSLLRRIDDLTASTVTARVAHVILQRADGRDEFTLGISQSSLAADLGTAREVVVRAIGELVRSGAIRRVGRSRFAVTDRGRLRSIATQR
jgi:CRP/FNR family transcriptional regulator